MCTKNHDMFYCSWNMVHDRYVIFHFGLFFALLQPKSPKNQNFNFKKMKKNHWIYHHFTQVYQKSWSYANCSWDMACDTCNCHFSFRAIFCPFILLTAQKIKISKKWKKVWRYHHFTHVHQKLWLDNVPFLRYGVRQMGRHTYRWIDGWKK